MENKKLQRPVPEELKDEQLDAVTGGVSWTGTTTEGVMYQTAERSSPADRGVSSDFVIDSGDSIIKVIHPYNSFYPE